MKRLFLVGCPRSGTTLLQSLIASHPDIVSFPETHLFSRTISVSKLVQFLTVYRSSHLKTVHEILHQLGVESDRVHHIQVPVFNTGEWVKQLMPLLDDIARTFGERQNILLEKTPRHLHFIDEIQKADPEAQFIHIIRKGEDVVASLHEATQNNPGKWSGARSLKKSIFWWNRSIRIAQRYTGRPHHHFVWYDELVEHTEIVLRKLFEDLGIKYSSVMLDNYHKTAEDLITREEEWKAKNTSASIDTSDKFSRFSPEEQEYIRKGLIDFDFSVISIQKN